MATPPLIFLNSHRAKSGTVAGQALHPDYVLLARFFGAGAIDRTRTLEMGVPYQVLQPIPSARTQDSFAQICQRVASDLVDLAQREGWPIQVTWSGGIDSTVALLSLRDALEARGDLGRLTVLLTLDSIAEYPWFYENIIMGRLQTAPLPAPLPRALRPDAMTVTGEHGDQLFGSDHLASLVQKGVAHLPYEHIVPLYMAQKLKKAQHAQRLMDYLAPQIAQAPLPIQTAFEYIWWCNFSLKWQQVSLRMLAFTLERDVSALAPSLRHFFADERFQAWSLSHPELRSVRDWTAYKLPAKKVILEATDDFHYFAHKQKEPSLKHVLVDRARQGEQRYRVHMYPDLQVHLETFTRAS